MRSNNLLWQDSQPASSFGSMELEREWRRKLLAIQAMAALTRDWDMQGAEPPHEAALKLAERTLHSYKSLGARAPDVIAASPSGSVVIRWELDGAALEAEIDAGDRVYWSEELPGGVAYDWEDPAPLAVAVTSDSIEILAEVDFGLEEPQVASDAPAYAQAS